jgi:hypothetical protein
MRATTGLLITLSSAIAPALAFAHGDHLNEVEGHSHWVSLAALGAVIVLAVFAAWSAQSRSAPKLEDKTADTSEG